MIKLCLPERDITSKYKTSHLAQVLDGKNTTNISIIVHFSSREIILLYYFF